MFQYIPCNYQSTRFVLGYYPNPTRMAKASTEQKVLLLFDNYDKEFKNMLEMVASDLQIIVEH